MKAELGQHALRTGVLCMNIGEEWLSRQMRTDHASHADPTSKA